MASNKQSTKKTKQNAKRTNKPKKSKSGSFEPKILAFCCNWCSYAGADLAGVTRIQYPPNIRILRIMCTGRLEPSYIFEAFESGVDGVIVSGCHPGDCHYISGNLRAEEQINRLTKLFDIIGFDSRRLRLQWVSAAEGQIFADYINEFVELIKTLGPNNIKNKSSSLDKAVASNAGSKKIRHKNGEAVIPA
jgi:F420-non-reducing hydrogenase iron-sulfur subunit